jgi:uncharacterized membrane protein YqjE
VNEGAELLSSPVPVRERGHSIGDLLRQLVEDITVLLRSEMRLASSEIRAGITGALGSIAMVALGLILVSLAMLCFLGALVAFLAQSMGVVAAAALIGGVALVASALLIWAGASRLRTTDLAPRRSVANLKRDVDTLKGD